MSLWYLEIILNEIRRNILWKHWCIRNKKISFRKDFNPVVFSNTGSIWNWLMNSSQKVDERGMKTWFILLICSSLHWLMYSLTYYHEIFKFHLQSQYVLTQYELYSFWRSYLDFYATAISRELNFRSMF